MKTEKSAAGMECSQQIGRHSKAVCSTHKNHLQHIYCIPDVTTSIPTDVNPINHTKQKTTCEK